MSIYYQDEAVTTTLAGLRGQAADLGLFDLLGGEGA